MRGDSRHRPDRTSVIRARDHRPVGPAVGGWVALALGLLVGVRANAAGPVDLSVSGFATLGYAVSNQAFGYQRFIDDRGTFKRDSVAGLQADASHGSGLGATLQLKAAPATTSDTQYD